MAAPHRFFKCTKGAFARNMGTWLLLPALGMSLLLGGCGKKGPLTLPEEPPPAESAASEPFASQPSQETP